MKRPLIIAALTVLAGAAPALAQRGGGSPEAGLQVVRLRAEPATLDLVAGQTVPFRVVALDAQGRTVNAQVRIAAPRRGEGALTVRGDSATAISVGASEVVATVVLPAGADRAPVELRVPVKIDWPQVERIDVTADEGVLFAGTTLGHHATALHADGTRRPNPAIEWTTSDEATATVDRFGNVTAHAPGTVTVRARFQRGQGEVRHEVRALPASRLEVVVASEQVRTGDVVRLAARATTSAGAMVDGVPVTWSFSFTPDDSIRAPGAGGYLTGERFVAEVPGRYTLLAYAGPLTARKTIDVRPRQAVRQVIPVGHGSVTDVHTSDLWVFGGVDGRDYALTGTWSADGWAYVWDVTDPAKIVKTDSIHVDARTVNDVKVAPDGRYAALSREGASNRRNGVVILDLATPAHPVIASVYDDGLTGGVHNMFATKDHLFALSGGDKYVILDVRDLKNPKFVSEYDHPDSRIHDVWVNDGIAYSSEWGTGVVVVDVGNGKWGGTIEKPKFVAAVPYPVGATHAAFPYFQKSTGRFYLFLGDEMLPRPGAAWEGLPGSGEKGGLPEVSSGYIHVIDFTDPTHPEDVARYEVKEFGTHNLWVEDDILFEAYYEGGVRMVDVSGELLGDLAEQGREIAVFKSFDPQGFIANSAMVWGAQPYKGHIYFSDHYSGLWSVKLAPKAKEST